MNHSPTLPAPNNRPATPIGARVQDFATGNHPESETSTATAIPKNDGYELLAVITAVLTVAIVGVLPTLVEANLRQLLFCMMSVAFVFGAVLAYQHQHHGRFWAFIVAAMLITTGY